ncbi:MAG: hypothetical protein HY714_00625 [Candidatus Omnitrophica bacterium]|nr:hypothetical protein [Candidatus Omnitrophota bacterium]
MTKIVPVLIALLLWGPAAAQSAETEKIFHCPTHPEVRQEVPGICPACGMKLVPVAP